MNWGEFEALLSVSGDELRGGCVEVGEGVLAKGETGTCVDDFRLGE